MNRQQRRKQASLGAKAPQIPAGNRFHVEAMAHHQAGRLDQAKAAYGAALNREPNNPFILHHLGIVACQLGDLDGGLAYLAQAVAAKPDFAEAQCNYGQALFDRGRFAESLAAFDRAVAAKPEFADGHDKRGKALQRLGRFAEAAAAHRQACALAPGLASAWSNLGAACLELGLDAEAEAACRRALAMVPTMAVARINLGLTLARTGRQAEAEAALRQAAADDPRSDAHYNLGCMLSASGCLDMAVGAFQAQLATVPHHALSANNLGVALRGLNRVSEAETVLRRALALAPDSAEARFNLALTLLVGGQLTAGWPEYEARWGLKAWATVGLMRARPQWRGQPAEGQRILIHAEQGLGDTIQFVRYVPRVAALGAKVVLEVQPELVTLLQGLLPFAEIIGRGTPCDYHLHCPLLSLPGIFQTNLDTIPAERPYVTADPARIEPWRRRLASQRGRRVGLVWAGSADNTNDRNRSLSLAALAPLLNRPGIRWFSLQKGRAEAAGDPRLIDLGPDLTDFAETAALVSLLDLVITVDTSVAHLAGAMGKDVRVMLPFAPDWRWLLDRTDSPWYPTMRLFRQPASGDWDSVVAAIGNSL
ncbi:MAG: tetratricopeptide repeat protein [Alphaproteobacteria bacterium]|nr:tetratricopeptide repeat protein [Alphaproteobacteria bacterium]